MMGGQPPSACPTREDAVSRPCLSRWLLAIVCLAPSPLAAQTSHNPAYAVLLDDVGTWDAEIVIWDAGRRPRASRGIEINKLGCNGTCLLTTVQGNLGRIPGTGGGPPPRTSGTAAHRELMVPVPGVGSGVPGGDVTTEPITAPGEYLRVPRDTVAGPMSPDARIRALTGAIPSARTSFAYPSDGKRVVTLYGRDRKGEEIQVARIVYTRRK